nr:immunoglobulin heavy chain junction region [Macaca mulatta]
CARWGYSGYSYGRSYGYFDFW